MHNNNCYQFNNNIQFVINVMIFTKNKTKYVFIKDIFLRKAEQITFVSMFSVKYEGRAAIIETLHI